MIQKILSFVVLAFCTFSVSAFPVAEGQQYSRMGRPVKEAPMVVEFFSFYCPPCMAFSREYKVSEAINQVLPEGTKVEKYHVGAMGSLGQNLTTAWSVAMALGVTDKVEHPLFIAVQDKNLCAMKKIFARYLLTQEFQPQNTMQQNTVLWLKR